METTNVNLPRSPVGEPLLLAVQRLVLDEMADRTPLIDRTARRLEMSPRTLQRRLRASGTTFSDLLEQVRTQQACGLLHEPNRSLAAIADALGFSEHSAFTRAFKRWTGMTPAQFRDDSPSAPITRSSSTGERLEVTARAGLDQTMALVQADDARPHAQVCLGEHKARQEQERRSHVGFVHSTERNVEASKASQSGSSSMPGNASNSSTAPHPPIASWPAGSVI